VHWRWDTLLYIISNFRLLTCGPCGPWTELWKGLWKKPGQ
jgi:hypothetical protein